MGAADGPSWQRRAEAAEKTVAVLKAKVREMYGGGGAGSAVHRRMEKFKQRTEEIRRQRELAEVRAAELQKYSTHLEQEVAARTRDIRTILDNVSFGFVLIDRDLRIRPGFTRSCETLLGRMPEAGDDLRPLLGVDPDSKRHVELQLGVDQVFEDLLPEEVTLDQLPDRFPLGDRVLRATGRAIRDERGDVEAILLTISDVTALEAAQREADRRDVLIGILQRKGAFEQFVADTRKGLAAAREAIADTPFVKRVVHTVKGNAASWGMTELTSAAHEVESATIDVAGLERLEVMLRRFLERNYDIIGLHLEDTTLSYSVSDREIERLRELAASGGDVSGWVASVVQRPARELLGPLPNFVGKLAQRLDKEVDFQLAGDETVVDAQVMQPVLRTLSHLIRNAVDHGLEPAWERGAKPARGKVEVRVSERADRWTVSVTDDGAGIPVDRLADRAVERGLLTAEEAARLTKDDKIALMFQDGVTSAAVTTEISGRGVGMSAVQEAVRQHGGVIDVDTGHQGTRITLSIPKPGEILR